MKKLSIIFIAALTACSISIANASTNKTYHLYGDPLVGTKIRTVAATSLVPFKTSYTDLSTSQQKVVKAKYQNLGVNDVPPFPSRGLQAIYQPVITANQSLGEVGVLKLTAHVNQNGYVETVTVHESPNAKLSQAATRTLQRTKFDAGTCNQQKCSMAFPFEIKFQ